MRIFSKRNNSDLITYALTFKEIECRCNYTTCNFTIMHQSHLDSYKRSRMVFNKPLTINSGYRCQKHNEDVGGTENSRHRFGALDISHDEFEENDKRVLLKLLSMYFDFVKVYSTFYHCHNDIELE